MGFKQPRVPEYREGESESKYLKTLTLFLKDFCSEVWAANRSMEKAIDAVQRGVDGISGLAMSAEEADRE